MGDKGDKGQIPVILTLFIPKYSHELRFLSTFAEINRQINRNLGASREQSQACLSYAEAKP